MYSESEQRALREKDHTYVWHPFTQMADWVQEDPIIIARGEGVYVYDIQGNRYLDGVSSLWTNVHGHRKKALDEALKDQIDTIAHSTFLGLSNVPAIQLAEELIACAPRGLQRVFYADSGSSAVEVALKVAYQYCCQKRNPEPQRSTFLHLTHSYHGDTLGSVSVGGIDLFHTIYKPLLFPTLAMPAPYCYRCPFQKERKTCAQECLSACLKLIDQHHHALAGVIIEPLMQGAAGMINQPHGFLSALRHKTKELGVLLICDEVATGFGRTGKMFASEWEGVSPDIMVVGKGITGGYLPLSATLFTQEIYEAFLGDYTEFKSFFHGHTYTGNQLAARVALANIEVFKNESVIEHMQPKIAFLSRALTRFSELRHVGDIRQVGFMVGIELVRDQKTREPYTPDDRIGSKVIQEARKKGVIIRPLGNVIVLMPPLGMSIDELRVLTDVVYVSIQQVTEQKR